MGKKGRKNIKKKKKAGKSPGEKEEGSIQGRDKAT